MNKTLRDIPGIYKKDKFMTKATKKIVSYSKRVPVFGVGFLILGIFMAILILSSNHSEDWSIYYIPFKLIGIILGYVTSTVWSPGIYVTAHFGKFIPSNEEKLLNNLGIKYRNKLAMLIPSLIYIIADFFIGRGYYQIRTSYFDAYLGMIFVGFFIALTTASGIKYLTVWLNIKQNWEKEFKK